MRRGRRRFGLRIGRGTTRVVLERLFRLLPATFRSMRELPVFLSCLSLVRSAAFQQLSERRPLARMPRTLPSIISLKDLGVTDSTLRS